MPPRPTAVVLAILAGSLACSPPRSTARAPDAPAEPRAAAPPRAPVAVPGGPIPIIVRRAVAEPVTGTRAELEANAGRWRIDPDAAAGALLGLALLDIEAEEKAWDGPDPEVYAAAARTRAISSLRRLLEDLPGARRRADALYLLGYCLQTGGDDAGAIDTFRALIFEHSGSPHVAEAWYRAGEIQFALGALDAAAHAYEAAAAVTGSRFVTLALYKLGWSHYQAQRFSQAAGAFERMLAQPASTAEAVALRPEARQMLAAARRAAAR